MNFQTDRHTVDVISLSLERAYKKVTIENFRSNWDFSKHKILGLFVVTVDKINVEVWHQRRGLLYHVLTPAGLNVKDISGKFGQGTSTLWMESNTTKVFVARLDCKGNIKGLLTINVVLCGV